MKQTWAAPERNKQPILDALRAVLPPEGRLLELSSGSGQHAVHFAQNLPAWRIQPSDCNQENLLSTRAWVVESGLTNLSLPLEIDVCELDWRVPEVDAVFNANMIHIAPWECCVGLMRGAARVLAASGVLVLYGPFRIAGAATAASNQAFDLDLRARDPRFGVRDLEAVVELAAEHGLAFERRVAMPANNQTVVFRAPT